MHSRAVFVCVIGKDTVDEAQNHRLLAKGDFRIAFVIRLLLVRNRVVVLAVLLAQAEPQETDA